ncbi:MAG: Stk1 family PASTA domain-containing Ser/Thr kinase [Rhodococcus sp.]|nr:Stk1 family PASTA domain-containing Ser/Thr kinase [Rhodococcus sp. (in: high G+C Gram-positive bacteria)]
MTTPRNLSSRYELGEILGFGGMSEVHLARDVRLSRDVAIKVLRADLARDPTFYLRFRREAQNAAALNHPAIVAVYDTGEAETEAGPLPYIVMEYVEGDTLRDIVRSEGPMAPRQAMEVISDVCAALDFSHRNGIVHRDVKPANVMINRAGAVKVMDFGIARAISDASSPMTQTAAVIGTAQYLSPEQARGEQVDARSDVYSLGCVLFEILTGEPPFKGDSPVAVAYQHVREDPRTPSDLNPDIPPALDSVILKAMSKNPANRYQSAADMRSDLVRVLSGQRPSAPMVMSNADRTTFLGAVDDDGGAPPSGYSGRDYSGRGDDDSDSDRRGGSPLRIALIALAVLMVMTVVGAFIWALGPGSPNQVAVPDVSGQSVEQAESTLNNLGFRTERQSRPDANMAEGNVIGTRPSAGSQVDERSTITLDVSTGPQQISVPRLIGLTQEEAEKALTAVGLRVDRSIGREPSDVEDLDKVIQQDPAAGGRASAGSTVVLTLGSGPEEIRVPDVTGQREELARTNLEAAGFKVSVVQVDSSLDEGLVVATDPPAGTDAKTPEIEMRVSTGVNMEMPDLSGMTVSQALSALRQAGWNNSASSLGQSQVNTLDPGSVGRIVNQQPAAGSEIPRNGRVSVGVGALGLPR